MGGPGTRGLTMNGKGMLIVARTVAVLAVV
jgi:hypothetical protein